MNLSLGQAAACWGCVGLYWWYLIRRPEPWQLHLQLCCWSVLGWVIPPDLGMPQRCPQCSNYPCCLLTAAPLWGCRGLARCWPPASLLEERRRAVWTGRRGWRGEEGRRASWQLFASPDIHTHKHTHLAELIWGFFSAFLPHISTPWVKGQSVYLLNYYFLFTSRYSFSL